jgi:nitrogen regulatory protein PII
MMKMMMLMYNEAIDDEVMDMLSDCSLKNYTKLTKTLGRGSQSGTHLGNDIWPGLNNILYVACEDDEAKRLIALIRNARMTLGREGIKAFMLPLEELT